MVFCCFRDLFDMDGKFAVIFVRIMLVFCMESASGVERDTEKWERTKKRSSISPIFAACRNLDRSNIKKDRKKKRCTASFSVEATMVFTVVILCVCTLICVTYRVHDTVTGTMILEEVLLKARGRNENWEYLCDGNENFGESDYLKQLEMYGEDLGDPRLWLGTYQLDVEMVGDKITGQASAGDWKQEMETGRFQPGLFLQRYEAVREIKEELTDDGSGIQTGNESELYGGTSADAQP